MVFSLAFFIALTCLVSLIFLLLSHRLLFKPALIIMLLATAAISYFQTQFGVIIDKSMIQNIVETDSREAVELMSSGLLLHMGLVAIIPCSLHRVPEDSIPISG